jgi:hypothetical protein
MNDNAISPVIDSIQRRIEEKVRLLAEAGVELRQDYLDAFETEALLECQKAAACSAPSSHQVPAPKDRLPSVEGKVCEEGDISINIRRKVGY